MEIFLGAMIGAFVGVVLGLILLGGILNYLAKQREKAAIALLNKQVNEASAFLEGKINAAIAAEAMASMSDIPQPKASA